MKKILNLIFCSAILSICVSACTQTNHTTNSIIKSERRFAKYMEPEKTPEGVIDLSEGPKLRYDANLGPKNLDFDIKIKNPY